MSKLIVFFCMLTLLPVISGCVPQNNRDPLRVQDRSSIKSTHVILNTTEKQIAVQQNNMFSSELYDPNDQMDSGAIVQHNLRPNVTGGLLSMLVVDAVNSYSANAANEALAPMRSELSNFKFLDKFKRQMKLNLSRISWLNVIKDEALFNIESDEDDIVSHNNENATLFVGTTYALNSTLQRLEVAAYVKLDEKQHGSSGFKTLYSNNFFYIYRLHGKNKVSNGLIWSADNGAFLKKRLTEATKYLANMITYDIQKPGSYLTSSSKKLVRIRDIDGYKQSGVVLNKHGDIYLISLINNYGHNGNMYAVNSENIFK